MQIQGKNLQIVNSYAEIAYFMQKKQCYANASTFQSSILRRSSEKLMPTLYFFLLSSAKAAR